MSKFGYEEALLLYAIGYRCRHHGVATLKGIISAEDLINRSAPLFEELEYQLNALLSAKLVEQSKEGYILTADGIDQYQGRESEDLGVVDEVRFLAKRLNEQFGHIQIESVSILKPEDYKRAYDAHYKAT